MNDILDFLRELATNNNREWFMANKSRYDACRRTFEAFVDKYVEALSKIDPTLTGITAKQCIWRIYRDVRFSANKNPYKEWFGAFPAAAAPGKPQTAGKHSMRGGYYIHLQPDHCLFAGGIWCPTPELLLALRREVQANYDEVESIMAAPSWKRYFGDFDTDQMLKRVPAGFDPEFVHADWLKRKSYTFSTPISEADICAPDFLDLLLDICRSAKPMNDFLNYTFEEYGEFKSMCNR